MKQFSIAAKWAGCVALLALAAFSCSKTPPPEPIRLTGYVNPLIGTGGHGHTFPGATLPFGMVQLSPDTRLEGWDGCSGYHDTDRVVYGFSHTHLSGTGIADYCDILFMPTVGEVQLDNGYPDRPDEGYASRFRKETEKASPGFYSVHLDDPDIEVSLTATKRVGLHRYRYPPERDRNVIVDLKHRDPVLDSRLAVVGPDEIEGYRISSSWAKEQHVYFVARFSQPFASYGIARDDSVLHGEADVTGNSIRAFFRFATTGPDSLFVKVGISAVDIDGARKNLDGEAPGWNFTAVRDSADVIWERALSRIMITDNTEGERKNIFYTSLYHTMIAPNLYSDVDGRYRGTDLRVHSSSGHKVYTVFSLWDTFRAAHPLYTIIERERNLDFVRTLLAHYRRGDRLPMWELAGNYTGTMIGYHAVSVILDAWVKGIRGFDASTAVPAMLAIGEDPDMAGSGYSNNGFIYSMDEAESVSKTLEYAYDDWCIAQVMTGVDTRIRSYHKFTQRAQSYKNLYDRGSGFMRARSKSGWFSPFDPAEVNFNYTEANAWQYSFFVPHDVTGLIDIMGGAVAFETQLDSLFTAPSALTGRDQPDITGLIGQYAHGNEPSHHIAYLYNFIGSAWKTQRRVRQILDDMYQATPDGLVGNEDCGQMSAWYVLSAMGFYPVTPGLDYYVIGTPIFERATINLENGNTFTIIADGVSNENIYVQSATLNGEPYSWSFLRHNTIMLGGELSFVMGPAPNKAWGQAVADRPVSAIPGGQIIPVPHFEAPSMTFTDKLVVELGALCDCDIMINIKHNDTGRRFARVYDGPITLDRSSTIMAYAVSEERVSSRAVVAEFIKISGGRDIALRTKYAGQYSGGGRHALIDYQRGSLDFRTGSWQGYEGIDLDAVVDLGQLETIGRVSAGFLQDIQSWIWFPTEVEFAVSADGETFRVVATEKNDVPDNQYGAVIKEFSADVSGDARYIRVRAKNYGVCPEWHSGAGGETWVFVDEISVD